MLFSDHELVLPRFDMPTDKTALADYLPTPVLN